MKNWDEFSKSEIRKLALNLVRDQLTSIGFKVLESQRKGSDLVVVSDKQAYEVKVRASRNMSYIFSLKEQFDITNPNLYLAAVLFNFGKEPQIFLIPARAWDEPSDLLKGKDYKGKQSEPEWGINLSKKNMPLLEQFTLAAMATGL